MAKKKEKKYLCDNIQLMSEWDWDKNNSIGITPNKMTCGMNKNVWWKCGSGHKWPARVDHRSNGYSKCPFCAGHIAIPGKTDIATTHPHLLKEWNYSKNEGLNPSDFTPRSEQNVWWICPQGHDHYSMISNRSKGKGCPVCTSRIVLEGYNDLKTTRPDLAAEWHPSKNGNLQPVNFTRASNKKVWWLCLNGHEWPATIKDRNAGDKCRVCTKANKEKVKKEAEILKKEAKEKNKNYLIKNIILMDEWDRSENNKLGLDPNQVVAGSHEQASWICKTCGHRWQTEIRSRTNGYGCKICGIQKSVQKRNLNRLKNNPSLLKVSPLLADEWHPTKNCDLTPSDVTAHSNKKVWWKCKKGHEWPASINSRFDKGTKCPTCSNEAHSSFPEQAIFFYLSQITEVENRIKVQAKEIDIYIPLYKYGIEYDGSYYHGNKKSEEREKKKDEFLKSIGINLFRVKECEKNYVDIESKTIFYIYSSDYKHLAFVIKELSLLMGLNMIDIDISKDRSSILEMYYTMEKANSIAAKRPDLVSEWHPKKNLGLSPDLIPHSSSKKVWWLCTLGHEWDASPNSRSKHGCPYCGGNKVWYGFNDIETQNINLANEWHYSRNYPLTPKEVNIESPKKVWWICEKGHEWTASPEYRNRAGTPCPYCSGEKILRGETDLASLYPNLAKEWDYDKNEGIDIISTAPKSNKKVWWKCSKCGFEWKAQINSRTNGTGCSRCSKKMLGVTSRKAVLQIDPKSKEIVAKFSSAREAHKETNINFTNICTCCKGRRKTAGSYIWQFCGSNQS